MIRSLLESLQLFANIYNKQIKAKLSFINRIFAEMATNRIESGYHGNT